MEFIIYYREIALWGEKDALFIQLIQSAFVPMIIELAWTGTKIQIYMIDEPYSLERIDAWISG